GDEGRVRDRRVVQPGDDEPGDVGDVAYERRARLLSDLTESREVDLPNVRRGARDDDLRAVLPGEARQLVVVDPLVLLAAAVGDDLEVLAREGERVAVRQVPAVGEVHAEDRVARLRGRQVRPHVGLRPPWRLHVA